MNDVHAFIVGIERYDQGSGWNFKGPVTNACSIADLLLTAGVPSQNIHLFLECTDNVPPIMDSLARRGVTARGQANSATVDTFWRTQLSRDVALGSKLIVYWSGHGYTDSRTRRIFPCSDYTKDLTNRVFNADNFARLLKGRLGRPFRSQIILADVCGTYTSAEFVSSDEGCKELKATDQVAYFATPEGGYAVNPDGVGAFTTALLDGLQGLTAWPTEQELNDRLAEAFGRLKVQACRISQQSSGGARNEYSVGSGGATPIASGIAGTAASCLEKVSLNDADLRSHFVKTVLDLGLPDLAPHRGIYGMVQVLADLGDGTADQPSFGLLQFLTRVSRDCPTPEITAWLAGVSPQGLANVDARLARERPVKRLLIEVHQDGKPVVARFRTSLREDDLSVPAECDNKGGPVADWAEFQQRIGAIVGATALSHPNARLDIHFLVDAPSFDFAFHRIATPDGQPIGECYRCTVHYLQRNRFFENWKAYCRKLEAVGIADLDKLRLPPRPEGLPKGHGLCYAAFAVNPGRAGIAEKARLAQMLQVGSPYLCWLHDAPVDPADCLPDELDELFDSAGAVEAIPEQLALRRLRGDGVALDLSLVWDDPTFQPFTLLTAVGGSSR